MRLATLDVWPDEPYLDNTHRRKRDLYINPVAQFMLGLKHDTDHLGQIADIVQQAKKQSTVNSQRKTVCQVLKKGPIELKTRFLQSRGRHEIKQETGFFSAVNSKQ